MSEPLPIFDRLVAEFRARRLEDERGLHEWRDQPTVPITEPAAKPWPTPYPRLTFDPPPREEP